MRYGGGAEPCYMLREVYYDATGKVDGYTENPARVMSETPEGIIEVLENDA